MGRAPKGCTAAVDSSCRTILVKCNSSFHLAFIWSGPLFPQRRREWAQNLLSEVLSYTFSGVDDAGPGDCLSCGHCGAAPGLGMVQLYHTWSSLAYVLVPGLVLQPSILQQDPAAKPGGPLLSAAE